MTTQRLRTRTPRQKNIWLGVTGGVQYPANPTSTVVAEILDQGMQTIGVNRLQGVTVKRIVADLWLSQFTAAAASPANAFVQWGITWVPDNIANAGPGDAQIPEPMAFGLREAPWIQQGLLQGIEYSTSVQVGRILERVETSFVRLDITQMRKQPTIDHRLVLITDGPSAVELNTVQLTIRGMALIGLP